MSIHQLRHCGYMMADYVATHHTTNLALVGGALCALATTELAVRILRDLWCVLSNNEAAQHARFNQRLLNHIGQMVLFGACATNAIPGIAAIAGFIFVMHALSEVPHRNDLLLTRAIRCLANPELFPAVVVVGLIALYRRHA